MALADHLKRVASIRQTERLYEAHATASMREIAIAPRPVPRTSYSTALLIAVVLAGCLGLGLLVIVLAREISQRFGEITQIAATAVLVLTTFAIVRVVFRLVGMHGAQLARRQMGTWEDVAFETRPNRVVLLTFDEQPAAGYPVDEPSSVRSNPKTFELSAFGTAGDELIFETLTRRLIIPRRSVLSLDRLGISKAEDWIGLVDPRLQLQARCDASPDGERLFILAAMPTGTEALSRHGRIEAIYELADELVTSLEPA